jgi:hypothetical protein
MLPAMPKAKQLSAARLADPSPSVCTFGIAWNSPSRQGLTLLKSGAMVKAVIFDMDGTLIDSVDLHAKAWQDAFMDFGHEFELKAIRDQIGKGGDQLLPVFLTREEIDAKGPDLEKHRAEVLKEAI